MYTLYDGFQKSVITDNLINNNHVELVVSNQRFPCNKISLQNASPYFQAMFNSSMKESTAGEIYIRDVEPDIFKVLLDYAHSNHVPILTSNENDFHSVCELLKAACIFQFDEVAKHCCNHLSNTMDFSNCLKIWDLGDVFAVPKLRSKAKSHLLWNGDVMLQSDEILESSFDTFLEIVSDDGLRVQSELLVLESILRWIKENEVDSEKRLMLYKEIRIADMTPKDVKKIPEDIKQVICQDENIVCDFKKQCQFQMLYKHSLKSRKIPYKPLLYGYSFHGRKNKLNIHLHIQESMHFSEISSICVYFKTLTGFGVCIVGKDVYMFGGREKVNCGKWNERMWKYDSLKEKWIVMPAVPFLRRHFQCAVVENVIHIFGGYVENRKAATTYLTYDIDSGVWTEKVSPVSHCLNQFVLVSGVYQGSQVLFHFSTGLHVYRPKDDTWIKIQDTPVVVGIQHAVEYGGQIYLMSMDPEEHRLMFYLYNPDQSELTPIATSYSEDWSNFTVLNGQIYIYTDNGVEVITAPSAESDGSQVMFKWRNEQKKALNGHLKFVGLVPFYGK